MQTAELIKNTLDDFERHQIRYCVLRNYEFLLDPKADCGADLDVSIAREDQEKAETIFLRNGFSKRPPPSLRQHQGYRYFSTEELRKIDVDVQWGGIVAKDLYYLNNDIYGRRKNADGFYVLSDEDAFIMYVCHCLLGKDRFQPKYKQGLEELSRRGLDVDFIAAHLGRLFGKEELGKHLVQLVKNNQYERLLSLRSKLIVRFIFVNHPWPFIKFVFRQLLKKTSTRNHPLIAFIGPDGAGKSTAVTEISKILEKNGQPVAHVYLGRAKENILPKTKSSRTLYARVRGTRFRVLVKTVYVTLDFLLRQAFVVRQKRKKSTIISDRYASDIYLTRNLPEAARGFLFSLFPKPTLTFYLYNDPETLHERQQRKKKRVEELQRQLALFDKIATKLSAIRIRTDNEEETIKQIASRIYNPPGPNRYSNTFLKR